MRAYKMLLIVMLLATTLLGGGCAKKTDNQVKAYYYPNCHEPLAYLHQRSSGTGKAIAAGAIQGGVISGIANAIIAAIAGGFRPTSLAATVAAGTVIGGGVGGLSHHSAVEMEDNRRMVKYLEEIDGDITDMNIVQAAATVSSQCYSKAFKTLIREMKAGQVPADAASKRFDEIVAGKEEAAKLLDKPSDIAAMKKEFNQVD